MERATRCLPLFFIFLFTLGPLSAGAPGGVGTARAAGLNTSFDFTGFDGSGFAPNPAAGQLDADSWSVLGLSDGDLNFGDTQTGGDFARGTAGGGVGTGGIYAFDTGNGNLVLGVQATGSDFTPGSLILRLRNDSGGSLSAVSVAYDIYYFNDQGRSTGLDLAYSTDGITFTPVPAASFSTPEAAAASPVWAMTGRNETLAVSVPDQGLFYLRWTADDIGGSGSRDEIGLDNIIISGLSPTGVTLGRQTTRSAGWSGGKARALGGAILLGGASLLVLRRRGREPLPFRSQKKNETAG